ncbi:GNAT family N-acetyltransferase [Isoptericola sp. F-RaC21]|uniref:GNAT family N-acetyltransferase n=1 Tax=Isoptericola sp. F-RaC21 TaxID=3141452 RepID=UPI00315B5C90
MASASLPPAEDRTDRLDLYRPVPADVDELFAIGSDPRVWTHYPSLRQTDPAQSAADVARRTACWEADGLGPWTVRRRGEPGIVGYGGCSVLHGAFWNLGYRFAVAAQGQGYATEMSRAAIRRAGEVRPDLPVIAYLLEHNLASAAVARKLGLTLQHRGPDAGNPDPGAVRLVFADRPLDDAQLAAVMR